MAIVARVSDYTIVMHPDEVAGYSVSVPALPGCFTQGKTIEEATEHAAEAIAVHLAGLRADGLPVPQNVRVFCT
jgi:predicted RNase H-like HicB family nuclease